MHREPILVASNGPLDGLLDSNSELLNSPLPFAGEGWGEGATPNSQLVTQNFELGTQNLLLAAADPPTDADLTETIEVQFTDEIRAKAQELGNNPVKIYNWVRNNIEYVPTYGSIQGANMCLQTKQCNDFDTASLLIALLRTSGIHARYVYGTIELPIEKIKNWVGGFTDSNAALTLIATGGIPVTGITSGGKIEKVRMEHVWVESWIDYFPSRGARHKTGQGEIWIPLDASFKQYNYTQGIDIKTAVPFDAQSFIDQIKATATINETEGYVTNVNSTYIQTTMTDYQTQVQNYISRNYPNATVGDVLGKKEIIKQEFPYLLGTLPYKRIVTGTKYSSLPDNLRHKISFSVTSENIYYDPSPLNITKTLPEIAGKKITLSYAPATSSDEALISAYLPKGNVTDISQLPSSLPAYLIRLKPQLMIDGTVAATGGAIGMGEEEDLSIGLSSPTLTAQSIRNKVVAGEYNGIALDISRISEGQLTAIKTKLETTKAKLEAQDYTNLTKDDIIGDILYITALSYFAELDLMDAIAAKTINVIEMRLSSAGRFFMGLNVTWLFGVPITAETGGMTMDIGLIKSAPLALDGDKNKKIQFMLNSGANSSALEHSVPEQLLSTTENPAEGISAVKALKIANDNGIPIYTINSTNINTVLPQLQVDSDVKSDIINAVYAGKGVTVSKTNITYNGWTGCGYIILDPNTGAGAYMISGGMNGGQLIAVGILMLFSLVFLILALITSETGIGLLVFGYLSFAFAYSALVLFFGKIAADEFIECLAKIIIKDLFIRLVEHYLMIFVNIVDIVFFLALIIGWALWGYYNCLQNLYSYFFIPPHRLSGKYLCKSGENNLLKNFPKLVYEI